LKAIFNRSSFLRMKTQTNTEAVRVTGGVIGKAVGLAGQAAVAGCRVQIGTVGEKMATTGRCIKRYPSTVRL